jgi:formate dehydrogenase iron-sulfur subunit
MTEPRHNLFHTPISRRGFFKTGACGVALGALAALPVWGGESPGPGGDAEGVLVDLTRCVGCRSCENACLIRQGYPSLPAANFGYGPGDGKLTFKSRTFVDFPMVKADTGANHPVPVKRQCMHCADPTCVSVCPVAALEKTPRGSVIYKEQLCIGCRYCVLACPFNVPRYEWDSALTPRVNKCDFCDDRIAQGLSPACVVACPTGTLKFGKRAAILQEARERLSAQPKRYATVFGDLVVGGTSWIYLSDIPMDELGFRTDLPQTPLPALTWRMLSKVPFIVIGVGLLLSGVFRFRSRQESHG